MRLRPISLLFCLYVFLSIPGYIYLGLPSLTGDISIQTYSDSLTYLELAKHLPDDLPLISAASNLLGPILILRVLNYDYLWVYIFNVVVTLYSVRIILKHFNPKPYAFAFFAASPLVFFSLFNVNKEVLALLATAIFAGYLRKKNFSYFILAFLIGVLARWQMGLFFIMAAACLKYGTSLRRRVILLVAVVVGISLVYPILASNIIVEVVEHSEDGGVELVEGSGIFTLLNEMQKHLGGYIVVAIPKLFQINFGLLARISMLGDTRDFWNYFVLMLHSLMSFLLFLYAYRRRRLVLTNDLIFVAMLFCFVFATTPIINIRYFYPAYLFVLVAATARKRE